MKSMKPPCEVVVKYILPEIRAAVAKELDEHYHLTQQKIATALGITQAAVSYYLNAKRANKFTKIDENEDVVNLVKNFARDVAEGKITEDNSVNYFCRLCKEIRKRGLLTEFGKSLGVNVVDELCPT